MSPRELHQGRCMGGRSARHGIRNAFSREPGLTSAKCLAPFVEVPCQEADLSTGSMERSGHGRELRLSPQLQG